MLWRNHLFSNGLHAILFAVALSLSTSLAAHHSDSTSAQRFNARYAKALDALTVSDDESVMLRNLEEMEQLCIKDTTLATDYASLWSRYAVWQLSHKDLSAARTSIFNFMEHVQELGLKGAYSRANLSIGHFYLAIDDHVEARRSYLMTIDLDKAAGRDCQAVQVNAFNCLIAFGAEDEIEAEFNQLINGELTNPRLRCTALAAYMNYLMDRPDVDLMSDRLDALMNTIQDLDPENSLSPGGSMGIYNIACARYWFLKGDYGKALVYSARYGRTLKALEVESKVAQVHGDYALMNTIIDRMVYIKDSLARGHASITDPLQTLHSHARLKWQNEDLQNVNLREQNRQLQRQYQLERSRLNMELMEQEAANDRLSGEALAVEIEARRLESSILEEKAQNDELITKERALQVKMARNRIIAFLAVLLIVILGLLWMIIQRAQRRLDASARETLEAERAEKSLMRDSVIAESAATMALEEAKMANEKALAFLMTVSHEVRTPLNAIMGANQILASKELRISDEDRDSLISGMRENSRFLTDLITKVLHLSRLESGCYNPVATEFGLGDICDEIISEAHLPAGNKVTLGRCPMCDGIVLKSDRDLVKGVMTELVNNACKFTPSGVVKISGEDTGEYVAIAVTDTGIGISKADAQRIFDPFEKLDSFVNGIGLGLSFCRSAMALLGGQVLLDQGYEGPGSRFVVTVPKVPGKEGVL